MSPDSVSPSPVAASAATLPRRFMPRTKRLLDALIGLLMGVALFGWLITAVGQDWAWWGQMVSPFALQWTCMLWVGFGYFLLTRQWRWVAVLLGPVLWGLVFVGGYWWAEGADQAVPANAQRIRLMQMNLLYKNHDLNRAMRSVQLENPDIVTFEEVTPPWRTRLEASDWLLSRYPHHYFIPYGDLALFSRLPIRQFQARTLPAQKFKKFWLGEATVPLKNGAVLTLVQIHPNVPTTPGYLDQQFRHIQGIIQAYGTTHSTPMVVMGDFNMTPWSLNYQALKDGLGLQDSMQGFGVQPTYPVHAPVFRIPIDHCLVSPGIRVLDRHIAPESGSDHLPMVFDLAIPAPAKALSGAERRG